MEQRSRDAIDSIRMDLDTPDINEHDEQIRRMLDLDIVFNPPLPHPFDMIAEIVEEIVERAQQGLLDSEAERELDKKRVRVSQQRHGHLWALDKVPCLENSFFGSRSLSFDGCLYAASNKGTHAFSVSKVDGKSNIVSRLAPSGHKIEEVAISSLVVAGNQWDVLACACTGGETDSESGDKATGEKKAIELLDTEKLCTRHSDVG